MRLTMLMGERGADQQMTESTDMRAGMYLAASIEKI